MTGKGNTIEAIKRKILLALALAGAVGIVWQLWSTVPIAAAIVAVVLGVYLIITVVDFLKLDRKGSPVFSSLIYDYPVLLLCIAVSVFIAVWFIIYKPPSSIDSKFVGASFAISVLLISTAFLLVDFWRTNRYRRVIQSDEVDVRLEWDGRRKGGVGRRGWLGRHPSQPKEVWQNMTDTNGFFILSVMPKSAAFNANIIAIHLRQVRNTDNPMKHLEAPIWTTKRNWRSIWPLGVWDIEDRALPIPINNNANPRDLKIPVMGEVMTQTRKATNKTLLIAGNASTDDDLRFNTKESYLVTVVFDNLTEARQTITIS